MAMQHNNRNDIEEVELSIEEAQKNIDKMEALNRLRQNKDFKELIEVGYLQDEASRTVLAKAEPALQSDEQQRILDNMINSIGYFRQYLNKIYQFGNQSSRAIDEHRNTRDELRNEAEQRH